MRYIAIMLGGFFTVVALWGCTPKKKEPKTVATPARQVEPQGPKKRVGIFEFENKSRYGKNRLGNAAVDALYTELEESGAFVLYERSDLAELEKEFDLIESGKVNMATAAQAGKLVGVQAVVVGTISQFGMWEEAKDVLGYKKKVEIAEATIDVRVVDVTSGRVIYADSGTGRVEREIETFLGYGAKATYDETMADKALRDAMSKFVDNLIREVMALPWEGYVMDVERTGGQELIYVNAGRLSGIETGMELRVKRVTGELTDPVTGEFKGYKTTPLGTAEVVDLTGEDVSVARMVKGSGAERGDMVVISH